MWLFTFWYENNIKSKENEFSENPDLESHVVAHYATIHRSVMRTWTTQWIKNGSS